MKFQNPKIEKLYEHLSKISREAYKDQYLISNIIISKQKYNGRILENYLADLPLPKSSLLFFAKKLFSYFVKNFLIWVATIVTAILHRFSKQKFPLEKIDKLFIIDTYFIIDQIFKKNRFEDIYFPGFSEHLKKEKKIFAYTTRWFGSKQPFTLFRIFQILKRTSTPALTPYQLLKITDYARALKFLIMYPFSVFRLMKKLGTSYEDKLTAYALWEIFDDGVMESYFRFLFGRQLSSLIEGRIKCMSWYEGLATDKNFYLGLRTTPEKAEIIGAQLFVRPSTLMNIVTDEQEIPFMVIPDKILVNGPGYQFDSKQLKVETGPALRYKHLFNTEAYNHSKDFILIISPYFDHATRHLLDLASKVDWPYPVLIKFHPTMDWKKYEAIIPKYFSVTNEPIAQLLAKTFLAIGQSTGGLIEAAALGIPTIDILYPEKFNHDYMPAIGKGILWNKATTVQEIELLLKQFQQTLMKKPDLLKEEGEKMKSFCFAAPTEELINRAFELD